MIKKMYWSLQLPKSVFRTLTQSKLILYVSKKVKFKYPRGSNGKHKKING